MATSAWARRRTSIATVAPELRHPALWIPASVTGAVTLRAGRAITRLPTRVASGVSTTSRSVPGRPGEPPVEVVVYEPPARAHPAASVLWIHGGGTIMGRPPLTHASASALARDLGIVVVSPDYRLAPEHPFPAALHDSAAVLDWLSSDVGGLGVDPSRVAVGGESAGGLLAASLCQLARDEGTAVAAQVLVYPMLDDRTVLRDPAGRGAFVWTPASNRYAWSCYLGHPAGEPESRPYAVPARCEDLHGLPPTWIGVGDLDLFHPEDVAYAERLRAAGVPCELLEQAASYHGADGLRPGAPLVRDLRAAMTEWLRPLLAG